MSWANKDYAIKKSSDQYRRMYFTPLPNESIEVGRPIKKTPIYDKLKEFWRFIFRFLWLGKTLLVWKKRNERRIWL